MCSSSFPRHRAAASLKHEARAVRYQRVAEFSAASGRGLIEAGGAARTAEPKHAFSAASGRGLIEAAPRRPTNCRKVSLAFSAASGRGLIEARLSPTSGASEAWRFPRHRAAASLKRGYDHWRQRESRNVFSAASGRGLIEAAAGVSSATTAHSGFPRHRAAASLKLHRLPGSRACCRAFSAASGRGLIEAHVGHRLHPPWAAVFRGIGPRPH